MLLATSEKRSPARAPVFFSIRDSPTRRAGQSGCQLSKPGQPKSLISAFKNSARISSRETISTVDAHRDDGKRLIVHADEKLSAFVELERQVLTVTFYLESIHADGHDGYLNAD